MPKGAALPPLPPIVDDATWRESPVASFMKKICRTLNPQAVRRPPPMKPETRQFLNHYFRSQNDGLAELVGDDIDASWYQ